MSKFSKTPLATAMGVAFAASATLPLANADTNPFGATQLPGGYDQANFREGKCGEGKCGEGKCGGKKGDDGKKKGHFMKMDANGDGTVTKREFRNYHNDKFKKLDADGDGKLSADEFAAHGKHKREGKCGEGKCGEGKCGAK